MKNKLNWETVDKDHVRVVFHGLHDEYSLNYEEELRRSGLVAVSRKYDKKNKQTITIYKRLAI